MRKATSWEAMLESYVQRKIHRRAFLKLAGGVAAAGAAASLGGHALAHALKAETAPFAQAEHLQEHAQYCRHRGRYPASSQPANGSFLQAEGSCSCLAWGARRGLG